MTPGEKLKWFTNLVKMRGYKDKYIDETEEHKILEAAIAEGLTFENVRLALPRLCEDLGYILESQVMDKVQETLEVFVANDGYIDEKEFEDTVELAVRACRGRKTSLECRRLVLDRIEAKQYPVKVGWLRNWYRQAKQQVGRA